MYILCKLGLYSGKFPADEDCTWFAILLAVAPVPERGKVIGIVHRVEGLGAAVGRMGQRERKEDDEGTIRGIARLEEVDGGKDVAGVGRVVYADVRRLAEEAENRSDVGRTYLSELKSFFLSE